jgi:hypothetical protein
MKIKQWQKNILSMGLLLSFFFLGGLSTARAETVWSEYQQPYLQPITWLDINSKCDYLENDGVSFSENYQGIWNVPTVFDLENYFLNNSTGDFINARYWSSEEDPNNQLNAFDVDMYFGILNSTPKDNNDSMSLRCMRVESNNNLVGGYFFKTPPASDLGAGVGTISTDVMGSLLPYIFVCGGLLIGFWLVEKIIALIPKDNTMEKADKAIARSEKDRKETKRIIATLD